MFGIHQSWDWQHHELHARRNDGATRCGNIAAYMGAFAGFLSRISKTASQTSTPVLKGSMATGRTLNSYHIGLYSWAC